MNNHKLQSLREKADTMLKAKGAELIKRKPYRQRYGHPLDELYKGWYKYNPGDTDNPVYVATQLQPYTTDDMSFYISAARVNSEIINDLTGDRVIPPPDCKLDEGWTIIKYRCEDEHALPDFTEFVSLFHKLINEKAATLQ